MSENDNDNDFTAVQTRATMLGCSVHRASNTKYAAFFLVFRWGMRELPSLASVSRMLDGVSRVFDKAGAR